MKDGSPRRMRAMGDVSRGDVSHGDESPWRMRAPHGGCEPVKDASPRRMPSYHLQQASINSGSDLSYQRGAGRREIGREITAPN